MLRTASGPKAPAVSYSCVVPSGNLTGCRDPEPALDQVWPHTCPVGSSNQRAPLALPCLSSSPASGSL